MMIHLLAIAHKTSPIGTTDLQILHKDLAKLDRLGRYDEIKQDGMVIGYGQQEFMEHEMKVGQREAEL